MRKIFITSLILASGFYISACGSETKASEVQASELQAAIGNWDVVKSDSHIKFTATQQGNAFTGEFKDFTADITFDANDLENASVKAVIDLSSVDAGDSERNGALPGKDWLYVKAHPAATFVSEDFRHVSGEDYEAHGNLTLRDMTKPVILPFTLSLDGNQAVMTGSTKLNRSDFGVGQGAWKTDEWVGFDVTVDVKITANKR